jgi:hypothetical protein
VYAPASSTPQAANVKATKPTELTTGISYTIIDLSQYSDEAILANNNAFAFFALLSKHVYSSDATQKNVLDKLETEAFKKFQEQIPDKELELVAKAMHSYMTNLRFSADDVTKYTGMVFKRELNGLLGSIFEELIEVKTVVKEVLKEKDEALKEKDEVKEVLKEKDEALKVKDDVIKEKDEAIDAIFTAYVKMGVYAKLTPESIAAELGFDISKVKTLYDELTNKAS